MCIRDSFGAARVAAVFTGAARRATGFAAVDGLAAFGFAAAGLRGAAFLGAEVLGVTSSAISLSFRNSIHSYNNLGPSQVPQERLQPI